MKQVCVLIIDAHVNTTGLFQFHFHLAALMSCYLSPLRHFTPLRLCYYFPRWYSRRTKCYTAEEVESAAQHDSSPLFYGMCIFVLPLLKEQKCTMIWFWQKDKWVDRRTGYFYSDLGLWCHSQLTEWCIFRFRLLQTNRVVLCRNIWLGSHFRHLNMRNNNNNKKINR